MANAFPPCLKCRKALFLTIPRSSISSNLVSRSCGSNASRGGTDGEVDEMARWSESHSDGKLAQLSVLTKLINSVF